MGEAQSQPGARRPLRASAGARGPASGWRSSPQMPCIQSAPRHAVTPRYCEPTFSCCLAGWLMLVYTVRWVVFIPKNGVRGAGVAPRAA